MTELTPEEKQKIYEEEKARLEMQEKIKTEINERKIQDELELKKAQEALIAERINEAKENNVNMLKHIGKVLLIIGALFMWKVSVPAVLIWYVFKKSSLNMKKKWIATVLVVIIFGSINAFISHENRQPTISIIEPISDVSVQSDVAVIKVNIDPSNAKVKVNGQDAQLSVDGNAFIYKAELKNEKNVFQFIATNSSKDVTTSVTVNRIFTEEEISTRHEEDVKRSKLQEEEKVRQAEAQKQTEIAKKTEEDKKIQEQLQREIDSIAKFDNAIYRGSVEKVMFEVVLFAVWSKLIDESKHNDNQDVKNLVAQLQKKVIQLQLKEFPLMRKEYGGLMSKVMWEHDVEAKTFGQGNITLEITGGLFASNKNIQDAQDLLDNAVKTLRFKKISYKWYSYDNGFYYTIDSPSDGEFVRE